MAPPMMEGIEEANREAVQSCHRVLDLLSNPHGQLVSNKDLVAATGEAVSMFESLTSKLDNGNGRQGHARVRKVKKPLPIIDSNLFLEGPAVAKTPRPITSLQLFPRTRPSIPAQFLKRLQLESRAVDLEVPSQIPPVKLVLPGSAAPLAGMPPLALPAVHLHFIQQHQSYQRFIQQMKIQSKTMMKRSNLGYQGQGGSGSAAGGKGAANLKVGGTNCAASSSRSFLSSMSLEGSPASLDGTTRPLQLGTISQTPSTPELGAQTKTKCMGREDGSGRCATLCHCANKKRLRFADRYHICTNLFF
jgi:hypothetical protein